MVMSSHVRPERVLTSHEFNFLTLRLETPRPRQAKYVPNCMPSWSQVCYFMMSWGLSSAPHLCSVILHLAFAVTIFKRRFYCKVFPCSKIHQGLSCVILGNVEFTRQAWITESKPIQSSDQLGQLIRSRTRFSAVTCWKPTVKSYSD